MKVSVFFGRFQYCHSGHIAVIRNALENTDKLIIIIGSSNDKSTSRNPLGFDDRKDMLLNHLLDQGLSYETLERITIIPMYDYMYNDVKWESVARELVDEYSSATDEIYLTGYKKDGSSYYLSMFPEWKELPFKKFFRNLSSSDIRKSIIDDSFYKYKDDIGTKLYCELASYDSIHKKLLNDLSVTRMSGISCESISLVISSGHILVSNVENMYELPRSDISNDKTFSECSIDTLINDVKLKLTPNILNARKINEKVFDDPIRCEKGRVIATTSVYQLINQTSLPKISGEAEWIPIHKLKRDNMCDDHFYILKYFLGY